LVIDRLVRVGRRHRESRVPRSPIAAILLPGVRTDLTIERRSLTLAVRPARSFSCHPPCRGALTSASQQSPAGLNAVEGKSGCGWNSRSRHFRAAFWVKTQQGCDQIVMTWLRIDRKSVDQGQRAHPASRQVWGGKQRRIRLPELGQPPTDEPECG
jgi:hypothetical protein